ncbi:hypothetical protein GYH30_032066 [Glycine max]|nr:hypothetical protein GYH30_032066 [Glycine max]
MRCRKGKKGWMTIKVDLDKAYDCLKWEFVKETLQDIGYPNNFVQLVWYCMSTTTMSLLWNGEVLDHFSPNIGVRQRDPIAPYLFVLCLERLSHLINLVMNKKL